MSAINFADNYAEFAVDHASKTELFRSALLVAADGAYSNIRQAAGISAHEYDYGQSAVVCNIGLQYPHHNQSFELFTQDGPLAMLPLAGNACALVWTVQNNKLPDFLAMTDEMFLKRLQLFFGYRLGRFTWATKRSAFPLKLTYADQQVRSNMVLLGNSAHAIHPIAGQGFNLALRDIVVLAEHIKNSVKAKELLGDLNSLRRYARKRDQDQKQMINFTDKTVKLFSNDVLPYSLVRSLGLNMISAFPSLRRFITHRTMGLAAELPVPPNDVKTKNYQQPPAIKDLCQQKPRRDHYDMIIVGGGIVGLALACALKNTDLKIAIIEGAETDLAWPEDKYELRVSAITKASQNIFTALNAWQDIKNSRISPYKNMEVWDSEGTGKIQFHAHEIQQDELGHIIENNVLRLSLLKQLVNDMEIDYLSPVKIKHFKNLNDMVMLEFHDQTQISCDVLVGADGGRSWVCEQAGFEVKTQSYGHTAIVATIKTEKSHDLTAFQRFMPTGPVAFLPLSDPQYCSIVWSTETAHAKTLMALSDSEFTQALGEAFDYRLGNILAVGQRISFPLIMRHAKTYIQDRIVLIGDAAHSIHPLAGQGVNLGLLDAASLAEVIIQAQKKMRDIGCYSTLRRYERWRKGHNALMIDVMQGFKTLFGQQSALLTTLRNIGMNTTHHLKPIKHQIIRRAMGLSGDLPNICCHKPSSLRETQ